MKDGLEEARLIARKGEAAGGGQLVEGRCPTGQQGPQLIALAVARRRELGFPQKPGDGALPTAVSVRPGAARRVGESGLERGPFLGRRPAGDERPDAQPVVGIRLRGRPGDE